jgi:hypothetical protein
MGSFVFPLVFGKAQRTMRISGTTKICAVAGLVAFAAMAAGIPAAGQSTQIEDVLAPPNTLPPSRPSASGDQIFAELVRHNEVRSAELREYSAVRTYSVTDLNGKVHAKEIVQMQYVAPDKKTFVTTMEEGSGVVRHLVLNRLMESETSAAAGQEHHDSSITPTNYSFQVLGEEELGGHHCFVVEAIPKRKDRYLFEGRIWIDSSEFAVVKIAGRPAKKLSFWITQADFVRRYEKIGNFWLPARDETFVDVRLYGKKILSIDHHINSVNGELNTTVTGQDRRVVESAAPRSQ